MTVAVYGASSDRLNPEYIDAGRELGRLLASRGIDVVCGGGAKGMMGAVTDGAIEAGGRVTGVIPRFMLERGWEHPHLSSLIPTEGMHDRKATMLARADAIIALPGGIGTFDELFEALTWRQLGLWPGSEIVILNTRGYYDDIIAMLDRARSEEFLRAGRRSLPSVAATPLEALSLILPVNA